MMSTSNSRTETRDPLPFGAIAMKSLPTEGRKVAPPHPGSVIADALQGAGISMRQAAIAVGMTPNGLHKVLAGKTPVTASTALRIEAYLGGSAEVYLGLQVDFDLWHERERLAAELGAIVPAGGRKAA